MRCFCCLIFRYRQQAGSYRVLGWFWMLCSALKPVGASRLLPRAVFILFSAAFSIALGKISGGFIQAGR
jgi:hypothetical protein